MVLGGGVVRVVETVLGVGVCRCCRRQRGRFAEWWDGPRRWAGCGWLKLSLGLGCARVVAVNADVLPRGGLVLGGGVVLCGWGIV